MTASENPGPAGPQSAPAPGLPTLAELGEDLLVTTRRRRIVALVRPGAGALAFAGAVWLGWWWLTPVIVFGIFVAVVTVTHDVVHRTIGLSPRATDWALFAMGLALLESGHAYRATHTQHHRLFPHPDDPEGHPAELTLLGAICHGPVFLVRLWPGPTGADGTGAGCWRRPWPRSPHWSGECCSCRTRRDCWSIR
ncbi:hypothetical protein [Streptomyces europaeiscabiei]|uniref:hypothetical protein n=1 Tax=Streptomyces europaeiscabiei TaxID=146819 RepID=UPI002B279F93|nr:hypothetical protein [Streptomyces europaeiscabiei]